MRGAGIEYKNIDKSLVKGNLPLTTTVVDQVLWTDAAGGVLPADNAPFTDPDGYIIQSLVTAAQGQTATQRIGRKWTIKSLKVDLGFRINFKSSLTQSCLIRTLLVWDKQCNGSIVKTSDVLDFAFMDAAIIPGSYNTNTRIFAQKNIANSQRFTIFHDKTRRYDNGGDPGISGADPAPNVYQQTGMDIKISIPYRRLNLAIESSTSDASIAGLRSNNIFLIVIFQAMVAGTGTVVAPVPPDAGLMDIIAIPYGVSRARFTDA